MSVQDFGSDIEPIKIFREEAEDILDRIAGFLFTVYPYKKTAAHICDGLDKGRANFRIMAHRKKYDLYLRIGHTWASDERKSIVVARIGFEKQSSGHGTALLKKLTEIAQEYDYRFLAIESVNANSEAFARKLGFEQHSIPKCYIIPTEALIMNLQRRGA